MSIYSKFKEYCFKRRVKTGKISLSPKGICFFEYIEKIKNGTLTDSELNETYEAEINEMIEKAMEVSERTGKALGGSYESWREVIIESFYSRMKIIYNIQKKGEWC